MRRHTAHLAAAAIVCIGLVLAAGPTFAGAGATTSTTFAFQGSGFGTRMIGGQLPAGSDTTGYQHLGCTNQAGRSRANDVDQVDLPGLGTAYGVRTRVWTTARHGVVATNSTHSIDSIVLSQSQLGSLALTAISSRARAYHDGSGFHAVTSTDVGGLTFTPAGGQAQSYPAPTPDQPVAIPGVATVYAGERTTQKSSSGAVADAFALRVDDVSSGTTVQVAHVHASLTGGFTGGVFRGHSAGTHVVRAGGDIAKSGPNPLNLMGCTGTDGKVREKSLRTSDLGGQLVATDATTRELGAQEAQGAHGYSWAKIGRADLGARLQIDDIVARAGVRRTADGLERSIRGTRLGALTVDGQQRTFPKSGVLTIPGVAKLERAVVTKTHRGISVIGLRITLLDGSGAVVDLAEASLRIRPLP
jgi:hypothetical protein